MVVQYKPIHMPKISNLAAPIGYNWPIRSLQIQPVGNYRLQNQINKNPEINSIYDLWFLTIS